MRQRIARGAVIVGLGLALAVGGCGYAQVGSSGGRSLGRVAVQTPENGSGHAGIEFIVADALRREVLRRAGAELVEDEASADWVVSGRVLPLKIQSASLARARADRARATPDIRASAPSARGSPVGS